jgi:DNA primase
MADQREEIKQKIDIVDLISEYVPLKKIGRNLKANCPFHSEKTPSFYVSPERQIWHCFGCNLGGDVYSFLMQIENIEFVEALRILAKKAGVALTEFVPTQTSELKDRLYEINHLAAEFFNYILTSHLLGKEALSYVSGRGVTKDSISAFKIGYAPKSWDSLLRFLRDKKGYKESEIEQAGLAVRSERGSYYDRFRGRLMFSLRDIRGNVVGFSGRVLDPEAKEAKYINSPETPIYIKGNLLYGLEVTKGVIRKEGTAVVVEGELDLISSYQAGVANVCAIKGSALTDAQVKLLKRIAGTIILSLDADLAGDAAAR